MTDNIARLLALMGAGGSGDTTDYEALTHKPSIGGVTLIGDLTLAELGIIVDDQLNAQSTNPVQNAVLTALLNAFPYSNVTGKPQINGVTLTGNVTLAELGLNAIWVGTLAEYAAVESTLAEGTVVIITDDQDVDSVPTQGSTNLVYSGGVYAFVTQGLGNKVDKETGKGLSTEDYTTAEKTKLAGLTNDYTDHTNKPSINGTILIGNKTLADLGIEWVWRGTRAQYEAAAATIPPKTFVDITDEPDMDSVPTDGSTNPVESNGVYDALAGKQDTIDSSHKLSANLVDDSTSTNKLVHVDNAGGLWVGSTQYIKIMDRASYDALTTKDDMIYMVYPTPSASLNMNASPRGVETPTEREGMRIEPMEGIEAKNGEEKELTVEGGDENADLQRDNGTD